MFVYALLQMISHLFNKFILFPVASIFAIACSLCMLQQSFAFAESRTASEMGSVTDFVDFWAASRLLITGGNPFSPGEVLRVQQSVGYKDSKPLLMWNPPWTLTVVLPFGTLDFIVSQFFWLLLHVFSILISAQILWRLYCRTEPKSYTPWIVTLTFIPCWYVLIMGQISPLILLGIAGFLLFERNHHYGLAGGSTALLLVKPHLVYLFWLALLVWILHKQHWWIALGALIAGSVMAVIPVIFDPAVYLQFVEMYRFPGRSTPFELPAPSLGTLLTLFIPHGEVPIQFVPPLIGSLWFFWHWRRHRDHWAWTEQIPVILLACLTLSAYAWTYDYVILLPAVIHGFSIVNRQDSRWYDNGAVRIYGVINGCYFIAKILSPAFYGASLAWVTFDIYFFWLAPAFSLLYLWLSAASRSVVLSARDTVA